MKKLSLFILAFIIQFSWAQESVMTPMDVANLQYVTSAIISDDGENIAYQVAVPADPTKENSSMDLELYLYDIDSETSTPFVTQGSVGDLKFRPEHNSLTFTSRREGDNSTSIYEIQLDGGEAQKIYQYETSIYDYDWHPDGEQLVFIAKEKDNKDEEGLPYQPEIYEENLTKSQVFKVDLGKKEAKAQNLGLNKHTGHAYWNHNGSRIAVSAAPTPLVDDHYTSQQIYILGADGEMIGEVFHQAKLGEFNWSPDGKHIAFIGGEDKHDPTDGRLLIADADGGEPQILQRDFKGSFDDIVWIDKSNIMFLASEGVHTSLGSIDLEGNIEKTIDKGELAYGEFSLAENGAMALTGNSAQHPSELFYLKDGGKKPARITTTNEWLENRKLGEQEVVTYKARDGREIQGILIKPVDVKNGQTYPLITVVHGGPESHYDNGWLTYYSSAGQLAAGKGYAVFYPNYRGSTGRGIEYLKSSQADPAGKEFDDVVDGIDHLIETGLVDKNKVGVTGGSYGGYATAWMSTYYSERFAAGVMFVGISDNISKWGTSDIPEEMFLVHARMRIWDDYQFFLERSPIYHVDKAQTPLLIMHGKEDTRVDPGQSYELYRHIKTRTETPVRLVLYPGEGHGNRNATARYDYNLRMMRWFDTYLKGDESSEKPDTKLEIEK